MDKEWDFVLLVGGAVVGGAMLANYFLTNDDTSKIPGPPGHWLKGNLDLLKRVKEKRNGYDFYTQLAQVHGPIYKLSVPGQKVFMISDPKTIHDILSDIDSYYPSPRLVDSFWTVAYKSLITLGGPIWRAHRKMLTGAFSPAQLRYANDLANNLTDRLITKLERSEGKEINAHLELSSLVWDILGLLGFSHEFNSIENGSSVMDDFSYVVYCLDRRLAVPKYLWNILLDDHKEFAAHATSLRKVAFDLVTERRTQIEKGEAPNSVDMLQKMLEETTEDGKKFTDEQVVNEMILFFIAGHETTANSMCWIVYRLAQKPELIKDLRKEILEVLGDSFETVPYESLPKLRFLDAVIKEALRIYPTVPLCGRYMMKDSQILGYNLPKGSNLILNFHSAHHNENIYKDPHDFNPYRWLNENNDDRTSHSYFPFGGGPKTCIGNKLAIVELKVAIVKIFHKFDIKLSIDKNVNPVHTLTLGPKDGLFLSVKSR